MKRIFSLSFTILIILLLSGCEVPSISYVKTITLLSPIDKGEITYFRDYSILYEDDFLKIRFLLEKNKIHCTIENKTNNNARINWGGASFIFPSGNSSSILCFDLKDNPSSFPKEIKPFTLMNIPPRGIVSAYLIPQSIVKYERKYESYLKRWVEYYSIKDNIFSEFKEGKSIIGLNFEVSFQNLRPLPYSFTFEINIFKMEVKR